MLAIFTVPKPFNGHIGITQRNAIESWIRLSPKCEVILLGDEEGTQEVARDFRSRFIPNIDRNEYGTPLVNSIFETAQNVAKYGILMYVNADIIFLSDILATIRRIPFQHFLMIGRRWNIDIFDPLNFRDTNWQINLRERVEKVGTLPLYSNMFIDYFIFTNNISPTIPPFAVGRVKWDNWMVYAARDANTAVIDASGAFKAIHQNHDYNHVLDGHIGAYEGPESIKNAALAGELAQQYSL